MSKLDKYDILDILTRLDCLDIIANGKAPEFPLTSKLQREHTATIRKKLPPRLPLRHRSRTDPRAGRAGAEVGFECPGDADGVGVMNTLNDLAITHMLTRIGLIEDVLTRMVETDLRVLRKTHREIILVDLKAIREELRASLSDIEVEPLPSVPATQTEMV